VSANRRKKPNSGTDNEIRTELMRRETRASDADREAVVNRLHQALTEGRITVSEFDERARSAYAAKTFHDLEPLTDDLPRDLW
jgi:hypothetical protein